MKCSSTINSLIDSECSDKLNHVNQLNIGDEIKFTDSEGNKRNGEIINLENKKDGIIQYTVIIPNQQRKSLTQNSEIANIKYKNHDS